MTRPVLIRRASALLVPALLLLAACTRGPTPPNASPVSRATYTPGQSYFDREHYIEYVAGNAPVIFTAPHGGDLLPLEIPDRTSALCGTPVTTTKDLNTIELVRAMQQRWHARFGTYPHLVISHLARRKLDVNRTGAEATCGNTAAAAALAEWHRFIDVAKAAALESTGKAWYMDMHGHGHAVQRLELGYLLTGTQLDLPDSALDANTALEDTSSIRTISTLSPTSFSTLLRGPMSLGTLYSSQGFAAVPSASDPSPRGAVYFSGGDDTRRHTCGAEATPFGGATGGNVCGIQIESNFTGVRDTPANRDRFGDATAFVLEQFLGTHWALRVQSLPH